MPGPDTCQGLARAFHLPVETVFRKAGLLPSRVTPAVAEESGELLDYYDSLTQNHRQILMKVAKALHEQQAGYDVD